MEEYNETGFPYKPRFSTSTTALPTMRALCNRKPSVPVYDYSKLYIPEEGYVCPHRDYPKVFKQLMKQRVAEQQAQSGQAAPAPTESSAEQGEAEQGEAEGGEEQGEQAEEEAAEE